MKNFGSAQSEHSGLQLRRGLGRALGRRCAKRDLVASRGLKRLSEPWALRTSALCLQE
ncbi:hypothetical protein SNOG_05963 [Parastagonospora nodorum SN15]|uniref:Uncharacterized protein n=1 Tax=Phaeosphaeria nodorum (strain SN15 / ATCC MYA-4574 / FGSC 10173) TaxID=321614 RepID=Q0UQK1_PHANO|nr:hypothetical protein SNOG_05963 [Parastagonospora nodorum SN15]EAT87027.1 hypothetical protein SNOG_05963 [Parastagonospora nodorum SN15]